MTEYFNPREVLCWITGGTRKDSARQPKPDRRKNRAGRNMKLRSRLYAQS